VIASTATLDAGTLPRAQLEASGRRVLAVKARLGLLPVPPASTPPTGSVDAAEVAGDLVRLAGTAADPDTPQRPLVRVLVAGRPVAETAADPATGGWALTVSAPPSVGVCAEAVDTGVGRPVRLGCVSR
jgi:beta-glucosidase-like glycosyl hydrolase